MASGYFRDDSTYIQSSNIFEWSADEKNILKTKPKSGLESIYEILNEIGYYGIRLKKLEELDPFETLVGGLSWCIGYIKPEFNYDIFYSEGMSLGKKIAISEKIIVCLRQMNYPEMIWPQQIQGLDYRAMEKLFIWLKDKITEIRNSLPEFESLAAQQIFESEFVFDENDCPSEKRMQKWFPNYETTTDSPDSDTFADSDSYFMDSTLIAPTTPSSISSFTSFLECGQFLHQSSYNATLADFSMEKEFRSESYTSYQLSEGMNSYASYSSMNDSSKDIVQLMRTKQKRIEQIMTLKQSEDKKLQILSGYKKKYIELQEYYRNAENIIQSLASQEQDEEKIAKLQELNNLLKLLESLNLQRTTNKQYYEEDLKGLRKQVRQRQELVNHEQEEYTMICSIEEKVSSSLMNLLSIYRSINLDILGSRCFLEKIPSKAELLFFEKEISEYIGLLSEGTTEISQYHDIINNMRDILKKSTAHYNFLMSFNSFLQNSDINAEEVQTTLLQTLNNATQQLSKITQQYNLELKKRNRLLKTVSGSQMVVLEKSRLHSKMMQAFKIECDNNKELMKRLRELQKRRV